MTRSNVLRLIEPGRGSARRSDPAVRTPSSAGGAAPAAGVATTVRRQHMRGVSLQSQLVSRALSVTARPTFSLWSYTSRLAWPVGMLDAAATALPAVDGTQHQPVRLQNCDAEWIQGPGATTDHVVLYLHGGAFLCCGLRTHRRMVSRISAVSRSSVLAVDYRMLPHHTISDAIADGVDAYKWLLANGYSAEDIVVAGDSAGGYLAFEVPLAIAEAGLPGPAGIVAMSPLTEMDPTRKLAHRNSRHCAMFPRRAVPALSRLSDRLDEQAMTNRGQLPRVCPVDADLTQLPPTLIQVGSHEMLYPDSALMAERLAAAGVPCELQVWDHQPHVFQVFADVIPEGHDAIAEIGRFLRSSWGPLLTAVE
ncbi:alpha/beta hydrolase [Tomitella gaofuii]|uniref:alpha/beta hydrolase n=1 Tax=Tomitella gaofuii TaxID=2760083 RepID=UPI0015F8C9F3|nr:alpha/beta hydrolase [Tomitella gaofuii]